MIFCYKSNPIHLNNTETFYTTIIFRLKAEGFPKNSF